MNQIDLIGGVPVYKDGNNITFVAGLMVDADGSPRAYHPVSSKGLDDLSNAGEKGRWYGIATDNRGNPFIQGPTDPCPGFYVSTTAQQNPKFLTRDTKRYLDAEKVAYVVLPPKYQGWGVKMGVTPIKVENTLNGKSIMAVMGDIGPSRKLGEASIAVAKALGINSNPRNGGVESKTVRYTILLP